MTTKTFASVMRTAVINGLLICTLPVGLLAIARLAGFENYRLVISFETIFPFLLLISYLGFAVAIAWRSRALAIVSALLIVCHLAWVVPDWRSASALPSEVKSAPHLTLLTHNVMFDNREITALAQSISVADADVVFLQELSWQVLVPLRESGALDSYTDQYVEPNGVKGLGIFSKYPLSNKSLLSSPGFPLMRAVVTKDGQRVTLINVHTQAPVAGEPWQWQGDIALIKDELKRAGSTAVAAGDFNATSSHKPYRDLLDAGFKDAHVDRGRGYARTWPVGFFGGERFGGYIRLDHVVVTRDLQPTSISEGKAAGSDHRAVLVDLAIVDTQ